LLGAGAALGLNHTTVSRRIAALEADLHAPVITRTVQGCELTDLGRSLLAACEKVESAVADARDHSQTRNLNKPLSGLVRVATTEAFGAHIITPILAVLHRDNPDLQIEIVMQTRLNPYNSGADIEIGVGEPVIGRPGAEILTEYSLGLYASEDYLNHRGRPTTIPELKTHSLIYYVEGLLRVDDLDVLDELTASRHAAFASTSVQAQTFATISGAGIGLLPAFVADREPSLRRVLYPQVRIVPEFTAWLASHRLRRPAAAAVMHAIRAGVAERQSDLLPD
jgi:DNA-binding transcriptional LysR family regulator